MLLHCSRNLATCLPTTLLPQWDVLLLKFDCLNYFSENGTLLFSRSQYILNQFSYWFSFAFVTIPIQFWLCNWSFKASWWWCLSWGLLFSTLKNETVISSEIVISTYQISRHHIPDGTRLCIHYLENPKSQTAYHKLFTH
jgi:hypothetical protein